MNSVDPYYPYTITLNIPYGAETEPECKLFRQGSVGSRIIGYQYVVTFESNVGDLAALTVDGSGLLDSTNINDTTAEVRSSNIYGHFFLIIGVEFTENRIQQQPTITCMYIYVDIILTAHMYQTKRIEPGMTVGPSCCSLSLLIITGAIRRRHKASFICGCQH